MAKHNRLCSSKYFLLDDTLVKNIALGVEDFNVNYDKINSLINLTKLSKLLNKSQNKFDIKIGELGAKISGGERQRLGIARALYKDPEILILDESTSALDIETEQEIINDIHEIMKNKTIIIISHRKSTLEKCDIIFELNSQGIKNMNDKKILIIGGSGYIGTVITKNFLKKVLK